MKSVMVDGPRSGEVITSTDPLSDMIQFAIAKKIDAFMPLTESPYDPYAELWGTATYRRLGRAGYPGNIVDVYTFQGMS